MREVFICDAARTPIGRYGGALSKVRTDDLAAVPIKALVARNSKADWSKLDEVFLGCANQSGEDNRNVARMALLLAGLPDKIPGVTVNRLCASGLNAVGDAARAIRTGEMDFAIAGGVESMTRAPFVMGKSGEAFSRSAEIFDTTLGWRFINSLMKAQYGVDSMAETAENVAEEFQVTRADQDAFALRSQQRAGKAIATGYFAKEIVPVQVPNGKNGPIACSTRTSIRAPTPRSKTCKSSNPSRAIPAPSRPAMRPASMTAPPRSSWRAKRPQMPMGLRPAPAFSAWRRPACRRASWASAPCRRRAS